MRTKQGTLRGYTSDGFRRVDGCRGYILLNDGWSVDTPESERATCWFEDELTPRQAAEGVRIILDRSKPWERSDLFWIGLADKFKGRLCPDCARAYVAKNERMLAEALADDVCSTCGECRGGHDYTCPKKICGACGGKGMAHELGCPEKMGSW